MQFSTAKSKNIFALALLLAMFMMMADDVAAQQRRSRRRLRRRPPAVPQVVAPQSPTNSQVPRDAEVVGTAEDLAGQELEGAGTTTTASAAEASPTSGAGGAESLRRTIERLSSQVSELARKISRLENQSNAPADYERLSRAEQRAEALHTQLRQIQDKELNLQARSDQLDYEMRPESLVRRTELIGSINPGTMRDQFRQQFEREKQLIGTQLEQLAADRARLDSAIASADSYVERLRKLVEADDELGEAKAATSKAQSEPAQPPPDGAP
ncbi:MAG: hypothetical protein WKF30_00535 [Pyrinomonadaceae bacterium]